MPSVSVFVSDNC